MVATADGQAPARPRWLAGLAVAVTATALLAAAIWFGLLAHWRPPLQDGERYGVDVSNHQGKIDWDLVADDGIDFAYVKATEGQYWVDARFDENWAEAARVGLDRGAYHYFSLCVPGEAQARNFLTAVPPQPDTLPPALDLEFAGNCSQRPPAAEVAAEVDRFIELVEDAWGRDVVLYVGSRWEANYPVKERLARELWQLRPLRRPAEDWFVWQIHGFAKVDGISGRVDLNIMRSHRR